MGRALLAGTAVGLALPATAAAQDEDVPEEEIDTIVVRGIKRSLEDAREAKRKGDQIKDVITAEDVGKLPDTNAAEALQRITGVQIGRDLGEGSELAVRGFSQNRVEVNGQTQVGSGSGSGVTFQTIPSDAFSSLEVVKTPAADDVEGGIGAIVRFNTRKPLDRKKLIVSGKAEAQYADRAEAWAENYQALFSNAWDYGDEGEFGVLLNYTHNGRRLRQDFLNVRGWEAVNGFGRDLDGDGVAGEAIETNANGIITDLQDGAFVPLQTRVRTREQDRSLDSVTTAIQWRPTDRFELYFDGVYTKTDADDGQVQYTASLNSAIEADAVNGGFTIRDIYQDPGSAVISDDQTVLSAFLGELDTRPGREGQARRGPNVNFAGNSNPGEQTTITAALGAIWEPADDFEIEVRYASGHGNQLRRQAFTSSSVARDDRPFFFYDFGAGTDIPTIIPVQNEVDGVGQSGVTEGNRIDLVDIGSYRLSGITAQDNFDSNNERAFTIDVDHLADWAGFTSFEYGIRYATIDGKRGRDRAEDDDATDADGTFAEQTFADLAAAYPGLIIPQPYDSVLGDATGDFPRDWLTVDGFYLGDNLERILSENGIVRQRDFSFGYRVERETKAYYLKGNFAGEFALGNVPYSGNVGVRYVETDRVALGSVDSGTLVTPVEETEGYENILPSANVAFELTEDTYLRFGVAKAMARPSINDIAPSTRVQFFALSGNGGNPDLEPEVVNQFDASFERYFGEANLLSVAYFYKDFEERIEDGVRQRCFALDPGENDPTPGDDGCGVGEELIRLAVPDNQGEATVQGVEIGYQQTYDFLPAPFDGFGALLNYTYVDVSDGGASVSATGLPLPVQDLSEHSYNMIGFYEKGGFSTRLAYNWRSEYFNERTSSNQGSFREPYGQLDGSVSYDVNDNATLTFEAINLLNEPEIGYQEVDERLTDYILNDTRFIFGLRIRN